MAGRAKPYFLNEVKLEPDDLPILRRAAERVAQLESTPLGAAAQSALRKLSFDLPDMSTGVGERALHPAAPERESLREAVRAAVG